MYRSNNEIFLKTVRKRNVVVNYDVPSLVVASTVTAIGRMKSVEISYVGTYGLEI